MLSTMLHFSGCLETRLDNVSSSEGSYALKWDPAHYKFVIISEAIQKFIFII